MEGTQYDCSNCGRPYKSSEERFDKWYENRRDEHEVLCKKKIAFCFMCRETDYSSEKKLLLHHNQVHKFENPRGGLKPVGSLPKLNSIARGAVATDSPVNLKKKVNQYATESIINGKLFDLYGTAKYEDQWYRYDRVNWESCKDTGSDTYLTGKLGINVVTLITEFLSQERSHKWNTQVYYSFLTAETAVFTPRSVSSLCFTNKKVDRRPYFETFRGVLRLKDQHIFVIHRHHSGVYDDYKKGNHYAVISVDCKEFIRRGFRGEITIREFDSLATSKKQGRFDINEVKKFMRNIFSEILNDNQFIYEWKSFPMQELDYNCGVFALKYTDILTEFGPSHVTEKYFKGDVGMQNCNIF
jgi:hypothetical protein